MDAHVNLDGRLVFIRIGEAKGAAGVWWKRYSHDAWKIIPVADAIPMGHGYFKTLGDAN